MTAIAAAFELQKAIYSALTTDAGMIALMGATPAVYDKVPDSVIAAYQAGNGGTYVTIGEGTEGFEIADDALIDRDDFEITKHQLHIYVWSQTIGAVEAKKIAYAARNALKAALVAGQPISQGATNNVDMLIPVSVDTQRAPDGVTTRALLVMRAQTSPNT